MAELLPSELNTATTTAGLDIALIQKDGELEVKQITIQNLLAAVNAAISANASAITNNSNTILTLSKTVESPVEPTLNLGDTWVDTSAP